MAFTLRSESTNASSKPQLEQPSPSILVSLSFAFLGLDATGLVLEAQTRGRVTTDIDASFVGAVELLSIIHSTSQETFQSYLTCFQLGCV